MERRTIFDGDCWISIDLLAFVHQALQQHPTASIAEIAAARGLRSVAGVTRAVHLLEAARCIKTHARRRRQVLKPFDSAAISRLQEAYQ